MRVRSPQAGRFKPHPNTFPDTTHAAMQPAKEAVPAATHTHNSAPARTHTHKRVLRMHTSNMVGKTEMRRHTAHKQQWQKKQTAFQKARKPLTQRQVALIIGISLLLMAIAAAIAAPPLAAMFVSGNQALTAANVVAGFGKFAVARLGWLLILVLDVISAWGIHKYYRSKKPKMAAATGALRLGYAVILTAGIVQLFSVSKTATAAAVYSGLLAFNSIWGIGLIVFGFHLIMLGILFNNEGGKKWVNVLIKSLLIIAGIGYVVMYVGVLFAASPVAFMAMLQPVFIVPMLCGEVFYAIWKLAKGGKSKQETETTSAH